MALAGKTYAAYDLDGIAPVSPVIVTRSNQGKPLELLHNPGSSYAFYTQDTKRFVLFNM
jgi:hypothetical protein